VSRKTLFFLRKNCHENDLKKSLKQLGGKKKKKAKSKQFGKVAEGKKSKHDPHY
jgi:hypothetical protein